MRVGIDKVDALINMVGELVITQSMLGQVGKEFDLSKLSKLQEGLAQLEHNTREMQESVMRIRMLPISFSFNRFPRLVRDISSKLGKKVELVLLGEQTELDKTVMEKIGDPLVHMVRNSLDHGLESPEERINSGKDETGTLTLNAYHQGGNIIIEITDDGKGIDPDIIRQKAIEKGVIAESDVLSPEQCQELIFAPGFSTAAEVSDLSGRGVGMDVVKRNIQELNGTVELESTPGKGSVFRIRLPLTLAILDGQLVRVGKETYILPLVSIIESLEMENETINSVGGDTEVLKVRHEYVPILKLYSLFETVPDSLEVNDGLMVIAEGDNRKIGLLVDELLGQQQVVIKSLETNYRKVDGVSGATILGDGTVALILDIPGLIKMAGVKLVNATDAA
jgi:two-component system chemotaxis sensor kinase CheA